VKVIREGQSASGEDFINLASGTGTFDKPFDYAGTKTYGGEGNYETYANEFIQTTTIPGCSMPAKVFVGQRNEAFKISVKFLIWSTLCHSTGTVRHEQGMAQAFPVAVRRTLSGITSRVPTSRRSRWKSTRTA